MPKIKMIDTDTDQSPQESYVGINNGGNRPLSKDTHGRLERLTLWLQRMARDKLSGDVTIRFREGEPTETMCIDKQIIRVDQIKNV